MAGAIAELLAQGAGSKLIALAGVPFGTPGSTNLLHVVTLSGDELEKHNRR